MIDSVETGSRMGAPMGAPMAWAISLLMGAKIFRAQTVFFLPTLTMFGGIAPNAWFAP